jgi:hypothetical protein
VSVKTENKFIVWTFDITLDIFFFFRLLQSFVIIVTHFSAFTKKRFPHLHLFLHGTRASNTTQGRAEHAV